MTLIEKAKTYAFSFHGDSKRISGKTYVEHLENTVINLKKSNVEDENILSATYLKHVLIFEPNREQELQKEFGSDVVDILKKYAFLSENSIKHIDPKEINDTYVLQAYLSLIDDYRVLLIRLASKVEDSQTLIHLPRAQAIKVAQRALQIYSPIARIVSLRNLAMELENNAFKILYPEVYVKIEKKINSLQSVADTFLSLTVPTLKQLLHESGVTVHEVKTRLKHIYGIFRKERYYRYKGRNVGRNYDGIKDILGLRIIVDTVDQCYETEDILKQLWDYIPEERDDYIQVPRASGYRAIHNVFKTDNLTFETQILTKDMYQYNEFGPAKHSVYKIMDTEKGSSKNTRVKEFLKDYISSIEKVSYQEPIINTSNKIYTFTPKGDIIELVKGAILLDFAYSIHADIGNKAVGGMINGKNAKLTDELRNGDKVEILVSGHKKKPSEDWIKLVKTSKARTLIRRALRQK